MIESVRGVLTYSKYDDGCYKVGVECSSGICYNVKISRFSASKLPSFGRKIRLYTHMILRENSAELFGFFEEIEREMFEELISVTGIGPSFAISILSELVPQKLMNSIVSGDTFILTKCKGIGVKTAKRIVLELKDKFKCFADLPVMDNVKTGETLDKKYSEAIDALVALGYGKSEVERVVFSQDKNQTVQELIKVALKILN